MKARFLAFFFIGLAWPVSGAAAGVDTPINLLQHEHFRPVRRLGMETAARGWMLWDPARDRLVRQDKQYVSGTECFRLSFDADGMTLRFSDPLALPHRKYSSFTLKLSSRRASLVPPAAAYRTTGRVRFARGALSVVNGPKLKPSPEWQTLDFTTKGENIADGFFFRPVAGAAYTFGSLRTEAVYPSIGGEIALPGSGKLTRFLLPENADYLVRRSIAMWRGWLWRLTGVALPIETVKEVKPAPGAFAAIAGRTAPGGWELTVNKEGITLVYSEESVIVPALFDYLRLGLGCAFYAPDCVKMPEKVAELAAIDRRAKPRFRYAACGTPWMITSGGWDMTMLFSRNDVDYYHLFEAKVGHVFNILLPQESYFGSHPEYFMLDRKGKRRMNSNPLYTNYCFSNPDFLRIVLANALEFGDEEAMYPRFKISAGDAWEHCLCPECVAFNGGLSSCSDTMIRFVNMLAAELAKRHPGMIVEHGLYATRHLPPKHEKPAGGNIRYTCCLTQDIFPCTLHVDCEVNRKGLEEISAWHKLLGGDPKMLGFSTYYDIRPLQNLRQMEFLSRFGTAFIYHYDYHGFPISAHFTTARWNLGEDPEKLMEEFDLNYYGRAGRTMHEITLLVDKLARSHRHTPADFVAGNRHIGIWGGKKGTTRTALTREDFDRIDRLFEQAMREAGGDPALEKRICNEWKLYMVEDFNRTSFGDCRDEAERKALAGRLTRFIRLARKYPSVFRRVTIGVDIREQFANGSGVNIPPGKGFWANQPIVDEFLKDPMKFFVAEPVKLQGGIWFPPHAIRGGTVKVYSYNCQPRLSTGIGRRRFGRPQVSMDFALERAPEAPLLLALEGLDDDKEGRTRIEIAVNDRVVFRGENCFPENIWGRMGFTLPADAFKPGANRITITDVTPDRPARSALFGDSDEGAADSQWGWLRIAEAVLLDPAADLERGKAGDRQQPWRGVMRRARDKSCGSVAYGGGKIVITSAGAGYGLAYSHFGKGMRNAMIAAAPGSRVRFAAEAAGQGKVELQILHYRPQPGLPGAPKVPERGVCALTAMFRRASAAPEILAAEPRMICGEFVVPEQGGLIIPRVELVDGGRAELTKVRFEVLPPDDTERAGFPSKKGKK